MRLPWVVLLFALAYLLGTPALAQGCSPRLGESPETAGVARGIQQATVVLLVVPWLLIGLTAYWYWSRFGRHDE